MTQTLLDPPGPSTAKPPRTAGPAPLRPRPRDPRWLGPAGIAASVLLHVVAFLLFRFTAPNWADAMEDARAERASTPARGMRVVQVLPTADASAERIRVADPEPQLEPSRSLLPVPIVPPRITFGPRSASRDPGSLSARTRPRSDDPRLWNLPAPPMPLPSELDVALAPLYARLGAIADSMYAAGVAAERALDWTVTDENGNKWGFSPGKIHLGPITLPLPFGFSPPPGRRDEYNNRVDGWTAIQRQAGQAAILEAIEERAKAIRARMDSTRRGRGGGG
jgi:hypothetical protein